MRKNIWQNVRREETTWEIHSHKLEDIIKIYLGIWCEGVDWMYLPHGSVQWCLLMNTEMYPQVSESQHKSAYNYQIIMSSNVKSKKKKVMLSLCLMKYHAMEM
jgi:hypothetical protein